MQSLTRRAALRRAGLVAGGVAAGGAVAAPVLANGAVEAPVRFAVELTAVTHLGSADRSAGATNVLTGAVASGDGGVVGRFHATTTVVGQGGRFAEPTAPYTLESHTFTLPAGTVVGQGTTTHEGIGSFAVVGGTGAYHGARGSYTGERTVGSFGGDAATYTFNLMLPEAGSGD